jgi:hypothetical protein
MSVSLYGNGNTVIQVLQGTIVSTQITTASASLVTTGISATITPQSTNSKILITPNLTNLYTSAGLGMGFAIYRGATQVYLHGYGQAVGYIGSQYSVSGNLGAVSFPYLDSPSTTSATTYTIYWGSYNGGVVYLNYTGGATVNGTGSYILLQEISGS